MVQQKPPPGTSGNRLIQVPTAHVQTVQEAVTPGNFGGEWLDASESPGEPGMVLVSQGPGREPTWAHGVLSVPQFTPGASVLLNIVVMSTTDYEALSEPEEGVLYVLTNDT